MSPFYDPICLNERAKAAGQPDFVTLFNSTPGISFRIAMVQPRGGPIIEGENLGKPEHQQLQICPGLAVIDKVSRTKPTEIDLLAKYCVLDGTIRQCPDLHSIIAARATSAMFHIRESIREAQNIFDWTLRSGFRKKIAADQTETAYEFRESELREMPGDIGDELSLQKSLLDALLAEIGIADPLTPG